MKVGVVVFPGSNCDHDLWYALARVLQFEAAFLWHKDTDLQNCEAIILPGGFSYGDYLRCGSIARFAPIMKSVSAFAQQGRPVLGICNGFQILTEAQLLPGALLSNRDLKFICKDLHIRVENTNTPFSQACSPKEILQIPIAHHDGNYFIESDQLKELEDQQQIVFRYVDQAGQASEAANPNGSCNNIAGICNKDGNVVGLMPHPERACETILGSVDGKKILESMLNI